MSPLFVGDQPEQGEDPALLVPDHHLVGDVEVLDAEATRSSERDQWVERDPGQVTDFSPVSDDLVELGALLVREEDRGIGIDDDGQQVLGHGVEERREGFDGVTAKNRARMGQEEPGGLVEAFEGAALGR